VSFAQQLPANGQNLKDPKGTVQKEPVVAPKVTVEVKKKEGKEEPDIKVQVEGNHAVQEGGANKNGESPTILPGPGDKLTPLDAEQIDKAAKKIERKLDEIGLTLGLRWGSWVWREAFFGITWLQLLASTLAIAVVILLERAISRYIRNRLQRPEEQQRQEKWKEVLLYAAAKPLSLFILVYGVYAALSPLFGQFEGPGSTNLVRSVAAGFTDLAGTVAVLWLFYRLLRGIEGQLRRQVSMEPRVEELLVTLVGKTLRIVVIVLGAILIIQNVTGLEIAPLLASLGLGGLAVALAAKDTIANFFGTLAIIFDKPFHVGEHIRFDKYEGVVESIGLRSTQIRTFDGALVSIPNEKAASSGVENVGRRPTIRWHTNLGLRYDTPPDKVGRAVEIVTEILADPAHMNPTLPPRVFFNGFNDWTLNIAVFAWFEPALWWDYQAWLQDKCLRIMRSFAQEGIEFAFPTRTLFVENAGKTPASFRGSGLEEEKL
jgi:MscS family membrane protein